MKLIINKRQKNKATIYNTHWNSADHNPQFLFNINTTPFSKVQNTEKSATTQSQNKFQNSGNPLIKRHHGSRPRLQIFKRSQRT